MKEKVIWILVEVRSGIPISIESFPTKELAKNKELELRNALNLENDETGIFQLKFSNQETKIVYA
jgi:hypothetical protein